MSFKMDFKMNFKMDFSTARWYRKINAGDVVNGYGDSRRV